MFLWGSVKLLCTRASAFPQCHHSFIPSVLWGICANSFIMGLCSLAFYCVHLCNRISVCFELVLVSLCSQRSSTVHICVSIPNVHCSALLTLSIVSWFSPLLPSLVSTVYTLSVWRVLFFPFVWGLMAGLPGFASHGSSLIYDLWELATNSGSSWKSGAISLHLEMLLSIISEKNP